MNRVEFIRPDSDYGVALEFSGIKCPLCGRELEGKCHNIYIDGEFIGGMHILCRELIEETAQRAGIEKLFG